MTKDKKKTEGEKLKGIKLHLRGDKFSDKHITFTLFMNGANCGQLVATHEEAVFLCDCIRHSYWPSRSGIYEDEVIIDGVWSKDIVPELKRKTIKKVVEKKKVGRPRKEKD